MLFVGAYILFAPFVGQFADKLCQRPGDDGGQRPETARRRLHLLRRQSVYRLYAGGDWRRRLFAGQSMAFSAKLTTGDKLVKANGLMESSTIAAILLGSMAGGILADWHVLAALIVCALVYGGAVVANLWIPRLPAARPGAVVAF